MLELGGADAPGTVAGGGAPGVSLGWYLWGGHQKKRKEFMMGFLVELIVAAVIILVCCYFVKDDGSPWL